MRTGTRMACIAAGLLGITAAAGAAPTADVPQASTAMRDPYASEESQDAQAAQAAQAAMGLLPAVDTRAGVAERERRRLRMRNAAIIGATSLAVAAYGKTRWWQTGFGGGFKTVNEGWFGRNTAYGGIDKFGHMYSNYADVRLLTPLFESAGNSHEGSVRLAAWTTVGIFTAVEVVDGFSRKWRFSPHDEFMNVAGALLGVAMEHNPDLDGKFDFRIGYRPSPGSSFNPFGDYAGQRYLLVAKADGFDALRERPVLRYLELSIGYQARGFDPPEHHLRRDIYVGVSLNLSRLLADGFYGGQQHSTPVQRGAERAFELVQFPTAAYTSRSLD